MISDLFDRLVRPLRLGPLTRAYPAEPPPLPPSVRGLPELDISRCDATAACTEACPTGALEVAGGTWTLDAGRCIFCGDCARACPRDALRLGYQVELAARNRTDLLVVVQLEAPR